MNNKHWSLPIGACLWFVTMMFLASRGVFVTDMSKPPIPIAAAFLTPIVLFFAGIRLSSAFRALVLSLPPILLIAMNGWRFIGLGFVMGYVEGLLPGGFAWPAGLGDIAMAVTAPWIAPRVAADDRFRFSSGFLI